jgi:hypothetical protein
MQKPNTQEKPKEDARGLHAKVGVFERFHFLERHAFVGASCQLFGRP